MKIGEKYFVAQIEITIFTELFYFGLLQGANFKK
jgi:hypothetical protein